MSRRPRDNRRTWLRFTGVGFEFVAAVAGFGLVGYWIDRRYDTDPWGVIIGVALGLIGGTYNLIRDSLAGFKELEGNAAGKPLEDAGRTPGERDQDNEDQAAP
jgi:F0F1-type ATP synthase assembly protein I